MRPPPKAYLTSAKSSGSSTVSAPPKRLTDRYAMAGVVAAAARRSTSHHYDLVEGQAGKLLPVAFMGSRISKPLVADRQIPQVKDGSGSQRRPSTNFGPRDGRGCRHKASFTRKRGKWGVAPGRGKARYLGTSWTMGAKGALLPEAPRQKLAPLPIRRQSCFPWALEPQTLQAELSPPPFARKAERIANYRVSVWTRPGTRFKVCSGSKTPLPWSQELGLFGGTRPRQSSRRSRHDVHPTSRPVSTSTRRCD